MYELLVLSLNSRVYKGWADFMVAKYRDAECKCSLSEVQKNALLTSFATMWITSLCIFAPNVTLGAIQSQGQIVASHWRNLTYSVLQLYLYHTMARISIKRSTIIAIEHSTTTHFHKWGNRRNVNLSHTASDLRAPFVIVALSDRMHLVVYRQYKCSYC